jgi:PAS domain S-box-containing protein
MDIQLHSSTNGIQKKAYPARPITEIIHNGFFTIDQQWTVRYWNKAAEKLLGVKAKDIVGKNLWEKFAGVIPLNFYAVYHKAFLQDVPVHFQEYWGEMGGWFDVVTCYGNNTLSVSFKSINHPEHVANPQQKLEVLAELYRFVTEVTNDCLWEWYLQTREIFWIDGGHKRVFGYPIENALIPQSFWESRIHPDDKERILTRLNKITVSENGSVWEDEYRFRKANGEYAYVHDRGHIIYEKGKASRMIGATQDITARKTNEIQLLESEKKLSLIARQTVNAVIITDPEENIIWVNSAFTTITEYRQEEVMGRKVGKFLHGKETDLSTIQYLRQKIRDVEPFDCEIVNYSKSDRKYWLHVQGQAILNENGNYDRYFVIATDITEKVLLENKLAEEQLTKQKEITEAMLTAQENERMDIGRELHDNLNQVLGATKLYIEMAKTDEENYRTYLDKSSGFLVTVIEEIRRISKTLAPHSLHTMGMMGSIKMLLEDLAIVHPLDIQFHEDGIDEKELGEKLRVNIFRIVQEQLTNILKHSEATGAVIQLNMRGKQVTLLISDNGKGCDLSEERKGVGIRNIMSRAELCNGAVEIESSPGKGFKLKVMMQIPETGLAMTMPVINL